MKENTPPPSEDTGQITPGSAATANEPGGEPPMYGSAAPVSSTPSMPPFLSAVRGDFWDFLEN